MTNVVELPVITSVNADPDMQLDFAKGCFGKGVVIIGYNDDGEFAFRSSLPDGPEVLWLLEMTKRKLLETAT